MNATARTKEKTKNYKGSKLTKFNELGGAISTWSKLVFTVFLIIGYGFLTYYQIQGNSQGIDELKLMIKDLKAFDEREIKIISERSDKRYNRALEAAEKLEEKDKKIEGELIDLIKEVYYIKGKLEN